MADSSPPVPRVAVFDPYPVLSVTIELEEGVDELHLHPAGQGYWVARMVAELGGRAMLVTSIGGETGAVIGHLLAQQSIDVRATVLPGESASYLHDRRRGERRELAAPPPSTLSRHELDDLYQAALVEAIASDICVLAGPVPGSRFPASVYERLTTDLAGTSTRVVADLSGEALSAALRGGVDLVKISHEELRERYGRPAESSRDVLDGMARLALEGAQNVVVSRAEKPTLAMVGEEVLEVLAPTFAAVDHRGGGDSMSAALAVAMARGLPWPEALRLGAAAGALNATRRGLASSNGHDVLSLVDRCCVVPLEAPGAQRGQV